MTHPALALDSSFRAPVTRSSAFAHALFPPFVVERDVTYDAARDADGTRFAAIPLPAALAHAFPKRRAEFLAGRHCAREALRAGAPEYAGADVAIGPRGEPLWPPGIVGSITHMPGYAAAVLARTTDAYGLGVDVEPLMPDEKAARLLKYIVANDELDALACATGWGTARLVTLVFSAKETLFKALFPTVRRYFDFRDARVVSVDPAMLRYEVRLLVTLTPVWEAGRALGGRFTCDERCVRTGMVLAPDVAQPKARDETVSSTC
jgi:enterobactin synthetase component D